MAELIARIGTFFILIGFGLLILFIASDFAGQPDFDYLFLAMLSIGIGWLFQSRRPKPAQAGRFGMIHRAREDAKKRREEQEKARKEQK